MALTHYLIASQTVGSGGAASVTFSSIPSTYTDLKIVASVRSAYGTNTNDQFFMRVGNGTVDSASNYPHKFFAGGGTSTDYDGGTTTAVNPQGQTDAMTADTFGLFEYYIPNYRSSNQKSISVDATTENNASLSYFTTGAFLWTGTSAIDIITFSSVHSSNLMQYSTFYLYGIKNS